MKTIISNFNHYHTPYQVESLSKYADMLDIHYYTAVNPKRISQECLSFPKSRCTNYFYSFLIGKLVNKYIYHNKSGINGKQEIKFSNKIARRLDHISGEFIFHSFNGCALEGIKIAQKKGCKSIVECGVHPKMYNAICKEECEKYNVPFVKLSEQYVQRTHCELLECDHILSLSTICKESFVRSGINESKISIIPISVDTSMFYRSAERKDKFQILYVGRITIMKGVQYLLDAFDILVDKGYDVEIKLAGTITDLYMSEKCKKYEDNPRVEFLGQCNVEQLRKSYSEASVLVMPSLVDSFCMSVYESLACKTPVIITKNVGAPITDGKDGYVVDIRDITQLVDRITRLYNDRNLVEIMGEQGFSHINMYTWGSYANNLVSLYNRLSQ